ncbi:hypothetical protein K501DRAFT_280416 [Backusella circina FSU 941]|nr:hypothetical protein K501DRAFT_280416 [Backusella circina FSU 941]
MSSSSPLDLAYPVLTRSIMSKFNGIRMTWWKLLCTCNNKEGYDTLQIMVDKKICFPATMLYKEIILQSLLDNEPQTVPSESIIRNIWAESHTLPATTFHNDKFKNLGTIHHKGLNVLKKITSLSTQNTPQRAMLYEVAYRMILSHATWLDENLIKHICILSDILKAWAECNKDPSDSILPTFERLLDQVGAPTDALSYEIIMNSYLVQAFFAAKSDLSDKSLIYYNRALDILNLNSQELQELKINYVYNYSLKIALELCSKGYDCAVRWLNNTVRRLKECNVSVQKSIVDAFIVCYQNINDELSFQDLKESFEILEVTEVKDEPNCCLCLILIISKLSHKVEDYRDKMKDHFLRIAEAIRINEIFDLAYLEIVMEGVDLIIHRYRDQITVGKLLLYKVHLFTKLLHENYILFDYKIMLKSIMDGVMIDKEEIEPIDMECIQLFLSLNGCFLFSFAGGLRTKYDEAYDWFNYSMQFFVPSARNRHNKAELAEKLAICCVDTRPMVAFDHVDTGLDGKRTALDYLLLIKYCVIKNNDTPKATQLIDELIGSEDFERKLLADVIYYIQKYNGDTSLLEHLFKKVMELSARNNGQVLELVTIHLSVFILRCLAESTSSKQNQYKLDFPAIGEFMKQICGLLCSDEEIEDYTAQDELTLKDDLEWLFKAAYHLCQHFKEDHDLYIKFLDIINWTSNLFDKFQYCSMNYTCEHLYIIIYTKMALFYSLDEEEKEKQGYYCISLESLKSLRERNDHMNLQIRFYEIEVLLHQGLYDVACDLVKGYAKNKDCKDTLLEKMTTSLIVLKHIQGYYFGTNKVNSYAKWTNVLVSHLENVGELGKIYEIIYEASSVIQVHNKEYPQDELFYLFSIAWNQGVMRFERGGERSIL